MTHVIWFKDTRKEDIPKVGGKAANLGELISAQIPVPDGFTVPAQTYMDFIESSGIGGTIAGILRDLDVDDSIQLDLAAERIKRLIMQSDIPRDVVSDIMQAYSELNGGNSLVAIRSSATAEDLPDASFAGQQETFLNVQGKDHVVRAVQACWASLFNARAIFYREQQGYDHMSVALAVVVQQMIQSEKAGVMFTINSVDGNPNHVEIAAAYGLGEAVVSGAITPDNYIVDKQSMTVTAKDIVPQSKQLLLNARNDGGHEDTNNWVSVPEYLADAPKLSDMQIVELAKIGLLVENHYGGPQDIEWAYQDGKFFLTQARPVTVKAQDYLDDTELPDEPAQLLLHGMPASPGVVMGRVVILEGPHQCELIEDGDILVGEMTTPDYVSAMKRATAIVTEKGGRTCHAAIVARELGKPCIVGVNNALSELRPNSTVTVDGSHGDIFEGQASTRIAWNEERLARLESKKAEMAKVQTRTKVMAILAELEEARKVASENVDGVGLLRMEFLLARIGKHPRAYLAEGTEEQFIQQLAEGFSAFCEPFGNRPVVLRLTDFKTNELENLTGGSDYEVKEENPMLGLRGAARYIQQPEVFALELEAIRRVREVHQNLWVMIPFVRTVAELEWVLNFMAEHGLERSESFKIWMMAEVPSNVLLLEKFVEAGLDGVSIGSNDLTQLILGLDRDNAKLCDVGDERNEAVMMALEHIVYTGKRLGITVGICGQAPSDYPELAQKLVQWGATSISVSPDRIAHTREIVFQAEEMLKK